MRRHKAKHRFRRARFTGLPERNIEARIAMEEARRMKPGPERTEAMKRAGTLRNAADLQGMFFSKRGRPTKT